MKNFIIGTAQGAGAANSPGSLRLCGWFRPFHCPALSNEDSEMDSPAEAGAGSGLGAGALIGAGAGIGIGGTGRAGGC